MWHDQGRVAGLTIFRTSGFIYFKPRLRVRPDAEDPFLIGREFISQGCDWPNDNYHAISAPIIHSIDDRFPLDSFLYLSSTS